MPCSKDDFQFSIVRTVEMVFDLSEGLKSITCFSPSPSDVT